MSNSLVKWGIRLISGLLAATVLGSISFVFMYLFNRGRTVISWSFLTADPAGMPIGTAGGIFPAIIGTFSLGLFSALIGGTLGVLVAVWIVYYGKQPLLSKAVYLAVYFLSGLPSIIFGLVGYTVLIFRLGFNRSLFCSGLTVSLMILPFVAIRVIKILQEHERDYYTQSLSLGISKEYTLLHVVLPDSSVEIIGTVFIGMAYGMGAVAPIMYTGAVMLSPLPVALDKPFMSLPYHLYLLVSNGLSYEYAYGTACVLLLLLLVMQCVYRLVHWLFYHRRK